MQQDLAEIRAMGALGWLVSRDDLVDVFLGSTGTSQDDLRKRASEPDFLASVLDFILMDDQWVLDCAKDLNMPPQHLVEIRQSLPGGDLPNWT